MRLSIATLLLIWLSIIGLSCSRKKEILGKIDDSAENVNIGEIITNPSSFEDKLVKVTGEIVEECPTGHWCYIKDETGVLYVEFSGFTIPRLVKSKVTIYGKTMLMEGKPMIHAHGLEEK